ncbi:MAG: hypothetical protein Solumvirus3_10 [Solumvirus sp.]|uniref:Uncharacterized protein n=1 Tax=Solumvirus sp. TaxID=2487773 RepID=A0A3G5AI58_9VIRU|nr:MAG: hypothetical protein Solumvirus3_10 [Solumvirus sp.]
MTEQVTRPAETKGPAAVSAQKVAEAKRTGQYARVGGKVAGFRKLSSAPSVWSKQFKTFVEKQGMTPEAAFANLDIYDPQSRLSGPRAQVAQAEAALNLPDTTSGAVTAGLWLSSVSASEEGKTAAQQVTNAGLAQLLAADRALAPVAKAAKSPRAARQKVQWSAETIAGLKVSSKKSDNYKITYGFAAAVPGSPRGAGSPRTRKSLKQLYDEVVASAGGEGAKYLDITKGTADARKVNAPQAGASQKVRKWYSTGIAGLRLAAGANDAASQGAIQELAEKGVITQSQATQARASLAAANPQMKPRAKKAGTAAAVATKPQSPRREATVGTAAAGAGAYTGGTTTSPRFGSGGAPPSSNLFGGGGGGRAQFGGFQQGL